MSEPFVGRRVEITGTSRADLNGKRGTAISFDTDKGRYRVRVRGSDMYLKPSNLLPVPETGAPSSFADVKDQAEQYADEFMSRLKDALPPGFAPRDALFAIVGFALLWRTAGLVRAGAVLLITVVVLFGGAREAYAKAGGGVKGARAGFDAAGTFAAKEVSRRAGRPITSKQAWVGLALLVVVAYQFGGGRKAAPRAYKPPRSAYEPSTGGSCADAYRRGFDDATAGRKYDADAGGGVRRRARGPRAVGRHGFGATQQGPTTLLLRQAGPAARREPVEPAGRSEELHGPRPDAQGHVWLLGPAAPWAFADLDAVPGGVHFSVPLSVGRGDGVEVVQSCLRRH